MSYYRTGVYVASWSSSPATRHLSDGRDPRTLCGRRLRDMERETDLDRVDLVPEDARCGSCWRVARDRGVPEVTE